MTGIIISALSILAAAYLILKKYYAPGALLVVGLVGAAAVLAIVVVARAVLALAGLGTAVPGPVLTEAADVRLFVFARDPDSDGHVRARAPGRLLPAV